MTKHRIVVAGCGGMANRWVDYAKAREGAEIVGLVDLYEASALKLAERKELNVPVFTDLTAALNETKADLVFDVTIPASHKAIVTTALEAGCNVFGEKPMAESLADAREITEVSNRTGKRYSVMQNRRYNPRIRALNKLVAEGGLGQLGAVHTDFFIGAHFGGFRDEMASPLIIDMAIHTFDQARFITGADAVSVYCHEHNMPGSWYKGDASAVCIFEMSDGSVFTYRGSWSAEGFGTAWDADWRVIGSKGTARWDGRTDAVAELVDTSGKPGFTANTVSHTLAPDWDGRLEHEGCLDEMFAALEAGRPAETDSLDNIRSMAMVFGAVESAKTGRKVNLS
ncbi:Gfo/Idh/MocA family protein [Paenibacillus daejeonensis]|uniref:Gfo/Idh/MocA family protein n=1 Tax=Paenibacillus daejeonensis TaxID=135193 RepID=UPI00036108A8|nr:Gfo/Idh/MocA family oxidoreductase [Paenibacillus daejeonensis]